ncbi:MAG: ABC transporter, partial [Microbacteriaceae bacterium]|nr:ABC transporter [Microbacteriaceae bacterium]
FSAAWPGAWQGKNYRDILAVLGYDVDKPWKDLKQKDRDWILFTEEKPVVTVHAEREAHRIQRPYQVTYMSAAVYVRHTFTTTGSATLRKRVSQYMESVTCTECQGKRLQKGSLAVRFAGYDIAQMLQMPLSALSEALSKGLKESESKSKSTPEKHEVAELIAGDLIERIKYITELGLDYLSLDRSTPTLSAGELQRLRLTTQIRSGLFGVVYVLDEPSAGLHPADSEALLKLLDKLKEGGNTLLLVEHEMDIVRHADWIVDIGPDAGEHGGKLLYSGPVKGLAKVKDSHTRRFLFDERDANGKNRRSSKATMRLSGINRNNLHNLSVEFPLAALTAVTGVSGSGKSTLVSQVLYDTVAANLGVEEEK